MRKQLKRQVVFFPLNFHAPNSLITVFCLNFIVETVAFDDLEEEICSPVAKRKREVSTAVQVESANISPKKILSVGKKARSRSPPKTVDSLSTVEKRLSSPQISSMQPEVDGETQPISAKSSSVKLKSTTSGVMKAYYPKIDYDISQSAAVEQALNSSSSHKKVLINLVQEICLNESAGLRNYGKDNTGRESIISSLQDILSCLPDEIASAVEDSATFSPELTTDEKEEILSLQRTLADLEGQYSQLGKFEANISDLGAKYNIWVDGAPDSGASARATASIQHVRSCHYVIIYYITQFEPEILT